MPKFIIKFFNKMWETVLRVWDWLTDFWCDLKSDPFAMISFWILIFFLLFLGGFFNNKEAGASIVETKCPAGQYEIDEGVCKSEPTGCPYGDSIPVDDPKCAPPEELDTDTNVGTKPEQESSSQSLK